MATEDFTDADLRELLVAVGMPLTVSVDDYSRSFEESELDSLARVEIASRIQARFGIDIEQELVPELTPARMKELVNERVSPAQV